MSGCISRCTSGPAQTFTTTRTTACAASGEDGVQVERFSYREVRDGADGTEVRVVPIKPEGTVATATHTGTLVSTTCNDPQAPVWNLTPTR